MKKRLKSPTDIWNIKMAELSKFTPKTRVAYIPLHANGDLKHKDVERGTVSSTNSHYVFVKFDKQLNKFGWNGTTSQACDPKDLIIL